MKKTNRFLAAMTASLLALTPLAATGMTAFAAGTATLTVTDTDTTEHDYNAYQIIKGTLEAGKLKDLSWGDGITPATLIANINTNKAALGLTDNIDANATAQDVAEVLSTITDSEKKIQLAKIIASAKTTTKTDLAKSGNNYSNSTLDFGWYLILDETNSLTTADPDTVRSANLLQLTSNTVINTKHSLPTLDKVIIENSTEKDANTAAIGDVITYNIKTAVPDTTGYNKYFFIVEDQLSSGLTFNQNSVSITILDKDDDTVKATLTKEVNNVYTDTTGDYYVEESSGNIKIVFERVISNFSTYDVGDKIVIQYNATLNDGAELNPSVGNPNQAKLKYSNDPNVTYNGTPGSTPDEPKTPTDPSDPQPDDDTVVGETPWDKVNTYTTAIKIKKVDQDGNPLKGATFTLYGNNLNQVKTATGASFATSDSGTYWRLTNGSYTTTDPTNLTDAQKAKYENVNQKYAKTPASTTITKSNTTAPVTETYMVSAIVDDDGYLTFTGLNAGTYRLSETGVPQGYNQAADLNFAIGTSAITKDAATWEITGADSAKIGTIDAEYMFPTTIVNRQGAELPSTGGMGTKLLYIFGSVFAIGSATFIVTRKRVNNSK